MDMYSLNNDVMNVRGTTTQPEYFEALITSPPELAVAYCLVTCCHKNCLKTQEAVVSLSRSPGCTNLDWAWWGWLCFR